MSKAIWKYALDAYRNPVEVPVGFRVLSAQVQRGVPCVWVEVDPKASKVLVEFLLISTGYESEAVNETYVGTIQMDGGYQVHHVFYREVSP